MASRVGSVNDQEITDPMFMTSVPVIRYRCPPLVDLKHRTVRRPLLCNMLRILLAITLLNDEDRSKT